MNKDLLNEIIYILDNYVDIKKPHVELKVLGLKNKLNENILLKPLTDDEIKEITGWVIVLNSDREFIKLIEKAHGIE